MPITLPKVVDGLGTPPDWRELVAAGIERADPTEDQARICEVLRDGSRGAETIARVREHQPPRAFEAYDRGALERRARWRLGKLRAALSNHLGGGHPVRLLDLGSGRGEVPTYVQRHVPGVEAVGLDIDTGLFEQKKSEHREFERIVFLDGRAERIPVAAGTFDVVLGYNSMEHFDDPVAVVNECERVLRPGGAMYFYFGPPFNGPYGPHLQNRLALPYFHHLFGAEAVRSALGIRGEDPYAGKNQWSVERFERLFLDHPSLECQYLVHECTWEHLWLVDAFEEAFRGVAPRELVVRAIEVVLVKPGAWSPIAADAAGEGHLVELTTQGGGPPRTAALSDTEIALERAEPRRGDFTTAEVVLPLDPRARHRLELVLENTYENPSLAGRVELEARVNGRKVARADVSRSREPIRVSTTVSGARSARVQVTVRAMRDCEPWSWDKASQTRIRSLTVEPTGASIRGRVSGALRGSLRRLRTATTSLQKK